jgi:hypothetical protein
MRACKITIRECYGRLLLDPANEIAAGFAAIVGSKTRRVSVFAEIEKLGFTIEAQGAKRDWRDAI